MGEDYRPKRPVGKIPDGLGAAATSGNGRGAPRHEGPGRRGRGERLRRDYWRWEAVAVTVWPPKVAVRVAPSPPPGCEVKVTEPEDAVFWT